MAAPTTATAVKPLSSEEQQALNSLLARSLATGGGAVAQGHGTATEKTGEMYEALTHLSVPRINDPEHKTDLVLRGNPVRLTDEQARPFLERTPPVIRKIRRGQSAAPVLRPRDLSGRIMVPPSQPPRGYTGPRADPAGSSQAILIQPEANEPVPGSENLMPQGAGPAGEPDAADLKPGGGHAERARAAATAGG